MIRTGTGLLIAFLMAGLLSAPFEADARSPLPIFRGVERLVLFCGRPVEAEQREKLCTIAQDVLEELTGTTIVVGTVGLTDAAAITVLVNGFPVEGPTGPVLAIEIDLLRKGHADEQLFGAPPVLVPAKGLISVPEVVRSELRKQLAERVVNPWRGTVPAARTGPRSTRG